MDTSQKTLAMLNQSAASPPIVGHGSADGASPDSGLTVANRIETLWKVVGRFDAYITSVNTKAALVATFNTVLLTAVVLKWEDVIREYEPHMAAVRIAGFLLAAAAIAAIASLWFTFRALGPFLKSPKAPGRYHSVLFFEHVSEHESSADYRTVMTEMSATELISDLSYQAHALAVGASSKFRDLRRALRSVPYVELPSLGLLIVLKLGLLLFA